MALPIEVEQQSDAEVCNSQSEGERRGERDSEMSHPQSSYPISNLGSNILSIPFLFASLLLSSIFQALYRVVHVPFDVVGMLLESNRQADQILNEVPKEQKAQQGELDQVHNKQVQQRAKLDELQARIDRIEARQASRINNANVPDIRNESRD